MTTTTPTPALPDYLREFVQAVADNYNGADNQDRLLCYGCDADIDDNDDHRDDCIVKRAKSILATQPAKGAGQAGQVAMTYTVDGIVMSPLEYIDYLHTKLNERAEAPADALDAARYREACAEGGRIHIDWSASKEEIDARLDTSIASSK